jgi:FSR family fosmidomycin resistance protein-like MFS transporter
MLQPFFGFFADNTLKRIFVFWGLILISIFIPLTPLASNVGLLIVFMILGSLGGSFFHPQGTGFVHKFASPNSNAMGLFMSFGSIGFSLGPLLAAFVVQYMGMEKLPMTTIAGLVTAGLMFNFVPKLSASSEVVEKKKFFTTFVEIFRNQQIRYLLMISMMKTLVTNSACILLPFLWRDMGCSPFYIGAALFSFIFAGGIGSFVSHKIETLIGTKPLFCVSMCTTFPLIIGFALTYETRPVLSLIFFLLMGFVTMLAQPVTVVMAQKIMPEYKSVLAGLMVGFSWGVVAVALSVIGAIAERVGIINTLIVLFIFPIFATYFVKRLKVS